MTIDELCRKAAENCTAAAAHWINHNQTIPTSGLQAEIAAIIAPEIESRDAEIKRLKSELAIANEEHIKTGKAWAASLDEIERLKAIITKHDLCHDLHGKVGHAEFEEGCRRESIKEHGSCLWADRIAELERENAELRRDAERYRKARLCVWIRRTFQGIFGLGESFELRLPYVDECEGGNENKFDAAIDAAMKETRE